jgi:methylated-DNA-[protein]-cysteine S-methyltransferase
MKTSTFPFLGTTFQLIADEKQVSSLIRVEHQETVIDPSHMRWIEDLKAYEKGHKTSFDWLIAFDHTEFQKRVFKALQSISFGETKTYGEIATMIGQSKASRAVGQAISKNPVLIVVPCHRVLASQGLGGFSSGIDLKKVLLRHERQQSQSID